MQNFTKITGVMLFFCLLSGVRAFAQQTDGISASAADSIARYKDDSIKRAKAPKISGTVRDAATGKPVSGISISVPAFSAAITDERGAFKIAIPNADEVLVVTGQGYQQKVVPVKGRNTLPDILLFEETYNSIYDVARLPFGAVGQNQVANAVTSISTQGAWGATNNEMPDTYLQGKVAGLNAVRRSGTPNAGANLFLRGYNSLYGTNAPLLVVDGMIYDVNHYGNSIIGGHINNPYSNLDLRDVDNYTILKDAAAGIYGTKGANGVILLSTFSNPDLATRIDFAAYTGYNFIPKSSFLPMMKAADYRTYLSDVLNTSGQTPAQIAAQPYMNDNPSNPSYYTYHNDTDWQKDVFKNGILQNYSLKVSGGDDIARYVLSLGYGSNKGITRLTDLTHYSTRFNGNLNISRRLTATASLSFTYNEQNLKDQGLYPKTNPIYLSLIKPPFLRSHVVDANGVESPNLADVDVFNFSNPESILQKSQELSRNYRFFGNLSFKYEFSKYFSAQTLIGVTVDKVRENTFIPRAGVADDSLAYAIADSRLGSQVQRLFNIYSDTYLAYTRTFNRIHAINAYLGTRYTQADNSYNLSLGYNSAIDQLISVGTGVPALRVTGGDIGTNRWLNNYFSANYTLYNKYILGINVTADASSRFGTNIKDALTVGGVKYAVLPSLSAAWIVSSEKFMKSLNFVELFKLRASYGLTGNDDVGNYAARQYYTSQNLLGLQGLVRANFGNPGLQWEVAKKLDIGFDASFAQERITVTADYFRNTTDKMIIQEPAPSASGLTYAITNSGGMQTTGFELGVNARVINNKVKWDLGFNIATYKNKITKLPVSSLMNSYAGATILTQVGMPAGVFYGYKTNGVYSTNAEAVSAGMSVRNPAGALVAQQGGDIRFVDTNGDKIIDSKDMQVIGDPNPDYVGGITTNLAYKRFTFNALFTYSHGGSLYNYTRRAVESQLGPGNQSQAITNRWRADGQVTGIPRAVYNNASGNANFSDRWIEDGSYMRLRTVSISYDVPFKAKTIKYVRIYATGNNLLTFTKYLGYDPEFAANENVFLQGIDTTLEPQFRTVQLGVRIGI